MEDSLPQQLMQRATSPMVPQSMTQPAVDSLTEPHLDQSPTMARIKGFFGGALEGARQQTTPLNAIAAMIPGGRAAGEVAEAGSMMGPKLAQALSAGGRDILNPGTAGRMGQMYEAAKPVFQGMEQSGAFAGDRTVGGLSSLLSRGASAGMKNPEFTAQGAEGAYNAARSLKLPIPNPQESIYQKIMSTMGK